MKWAVYEGEQLVASGETDETVSAKVWEGTKDGLVHATIGVEFANAVDDPFVYIRERGIINE